MECFAVQKVLDASMDGELDPSTQHRVDAHLECCVDCAAQLGFSQVVKGATKQALTARAPEALREEVLRALQRPARPRMDRRWGALAVGGVGLAVAVWTGTALLAPRELGGAQLARLAALQASDGSVTSRRPEKAELVRETELDLDGLVVQHRHYRLGAASFTVLSSQEPIPVRLTDQAAIDGASVQHETQNGTTVAAALHAPQFVVMSQDSALALEFATLNLLQRLAE